MESAAISFRSDWQFDNRCFLWKPQPDITPFEIALALPMIVSHTGSVGLAFDKLPAEVQRHFELVTR